MYRELEEAVFPPSSEYLYLVRITLQTDVALSNIH